MDKLTRDEEEKLIARSQQGDVSAFNLLVLCHQQVVYKIRSSASSAITIPHLM